MLKRCKSIQFLLALVLTTTALSASAGFQVSGRNLLDGNGNVFVMRGINHAYTWYTGENGSFADIAATGANTVRVVLSNGTQWTRNNGDEVQNIIDLCKANSLICVLEVHDSTGYPEQGSATHITNATNYWLSSDILPVIQGQEDFVILNIANEPFGNNVAESTYVNDTRSAIQALRNGGLQHTLMIDAGNWGQDWQNLMRNNAPEIFSSDPDSNVIFDVHMYEVYGNASSVNDYMQAFASNNLHLVVGEFGATHGGSNVDEDSILAFAQQFGFGYLGWSWSGNGSCCADLDIALNFDAGNLSSWGSRLIEGSNGIRQTSQIASVYTGGSSSGDSSSSSGSSSSGGGDENCTWSDGTVWPMCEIDTGDWGWENGQSCVSQSICPSGSSSGSSSGGSSSSSSSGSGTGGTSCTWTDGSVWAMCEVDTGGWGWENNQSCVSSSICPDGNTADSCTWSDGSVWPICSNDVGGWGWEDNQSCVSASICPQ